MPLGQLEAIEDPRLVRIANYEDGVSGRHDASRVLAPFLAALGHPGEPKRAAVLLHDAESSNKIVQTLLEIVRGGIEQVPLEVEVCYSGVALDADFVASLPFPVRRLTGNAAEFQNLLRESSMDFAILFESSGMYRGEDLVGRVAPGGWPFRRGLGQPAAVGPRHRGVIPPAIPADAARRRDQLRGSHLLSVAYCLLCGATSRTRSRACEASRRRQ